MQLDARIGQLAFGQTRGRVSAKEARFCNHLQHSPRQARRIELVSMLRSSDAVVASAGHAGKWPVIGERSFPGSCHVSGVLRGVVARTASVGGGAGQDSEAGLEQGHRLDPRPVYGGGRENDRVEQPSISSCRGLTSVR